VIAEWTFQHQLLRGVYVPLEHHLRFGRHVESARHRLRQLYRLPPQESGEQEFINRWRERGGSGVDTGRIAAQRDDHRHPLAARGHLAPVPRGNLVPLPVHRERALSEYLYPVHAHIPSSPTWVRRDDHRKRNVPAAIFGPGREERNNIEIYGVIPLDDFLAGRTAPLYTGRELPDLGQPRQHGQFPEQSLGHLQIEHVRDPAADIVELLGAQRQAHPAHRAKEVDHYRQGASLSILEKYMLEQQCRSSTGTLHDPVGDLGYLQVGPHWMCYPGELADSIYGLDKVPKVVQGHIRKA
jgi:hypothetical protein